MNAFPWTIFFILFAAGLLSTALVVPYSLALSRKTFDKAQKAAEGQDRVQKKLPPIPVLILASLVQGGILIGAAAFLGLLAAQKVGLEIPVLTAAVQGQPVTGIIVGFLPASLLMGLAAGMIMLVLEGLYFAPRIPKELSMLDAKTALWKRVLACFYGGISEEILLRLFVMSVLVWLAGLLWTNPSGMPAAGAFWLANILASLLFGAGHLPATKSAVGKLTPIVVGRGLLLNGIPGIVFGYLFMRYGLEAAMLSHFSLDILIHLIAPNFMRRIVESNQSGPSAQPI